MYVLNTATRASIGSTNDNGDDGMESGSSPLSCVFPSCDILSNWHKVKVLGSPSRPTAHPEGELHPPTIVRFLSLLLVEQHLAVLLCSSSSASTTLQLQRPPWPRFNRCIVESFD
jgi:hypothetical protein